METIESPRRWLPLAVAGAGYTALAIVVTFPLVLHLSSHLPKDLGDPLVVTAILAWNAQVVPLTEQWWNGFGFYPAGGMMAFSEHFLGASLIASPLQWLGLDAITAYNLTFLASFPLSALAAHGLALALTKRHDAAVVCGLAYGFTPYRIGHVEHLELLLAYGMPAALLAMHKYAETRQARWLAVLTIALILQALSTSYYALFFTVLFGLWILWFVRPRAWREAAALIAAAASAALIISPIIFAYTRIHARFTWRRELAEEVRKFSADLSSFVSASPLSALWGWTGSLEDGERQLFPGLTVIVLTVAGVVLLMRSRPAADDRLSAVSRTFWALSGAFALVAIAARTIGPWRIDWGWTTVSVTVAYKPLSLAFAFAVLALALGPTLREGFRQRSALAFYLVAAALFFLLTTGPEPTAWGERILYEPPYAWLTRLPFFGNSVRVPARFGMLAILSLAVAGSLAFDRLAARNPRRRQLAAVIVTALIADGWIGGLPLGEVPKTAFQIKPEDRPAAVIELPFGDLWRDTAAMYRGIHHGVPVVNGYNGFEPLYYQTLRRALADHDETVLDALSTVGPLLIAADNTLIAESASASFLSSHRRLERLREDGDSTLYRLGFAPAPPAPPRCRGGLLEIRAAFDAHGSVDATWLTDQDPQTRWITPSAQRAGDELILDLGQVERVCELGVSTGLEAAYYAGTLRIETSVDKTTWHTAFVGKMGGSVLLATLEKPRDATVWVPMAEQTARFIRLQVDVSHDVYPWAVADIEVRDADGAPR